jgi:hypothetical protein
MTNVLEEYNSTNNLGYTKTELLELAMWGTQESATYKSCITGLSEKNNTTFKEEEEKYRDRIAEITWIETKRETK